MPDAVAERTGNPPEYITYPISPIPGRKYYLNGVTDEDARQFWFKYDLQIEQDVFIKGVLAMRQRLQLMARFEEGEVYLGLKIGNYKFTKLEFDIIRNAWTRSRWATLCHLSRLHWILIVACIFAAMTQGWDQAAMAGAAIRIMTSLGRPITSTAASDSTSTASDNTLPLTENTWLFGVLVGAPFLFGAPLGLLITDRLTEIWRFGRRGAICVAGLFSFASVIGSAAVHKWGDFLAFRLLLGAGMAGKASVVPILLSETSPKNIRGILLVSWQLFVAFGLAAGSTANLSVYHLNAHESWRYMFISAFIPALLLFSLVLFSPESPRWLLKKSGVKNSAGNHQYSAARVREALKSLIQLHDEPTHILAAGELYLLYRRLLDEQNKLGIDPADAVMTKSNLARPQAGIQENGQELDDFQTRNAQALVMGSDSEASAQCYPLVVPISYVSWATRWRLMFRDERIRRANYAAAAVMIAQQLCGINLLAFLADTFFRNSFFDTRKDTEPTVQQNTQLLAFSFGFGMLNFVSTIPALFFIDNTQGRRALLNCSFPAMALSLLISALVLLVPAQDPTTGRARDEIIGVHFFFLATFTIAYSIGEGPAAFVISAEVFPLVNRELGMSLAVFWNFLGAGLLSLFAPFLTKRMGQVGILGLFSGTNLLAWFACYWLIPDTGNEELEEIFERLNIPTRYAFRYAYTTIWERFRRSFFYCIYFGRKNWKDCGNGKEILSLQDAHVELEGQQVQHAVP